MINCSMSTKCSQFYAQDCVYMGHDMRKPVLGNGGGGLCFANSKGADQPAHPRSLISTFVINLLKSISCLCFKQNFNSLASLCKWVGWFEQDLVRNTEDRFSHE